MMLKINNGTTDIAVEKPTVNNGTTDIAISKVTVNDGTSDKLVWNSWNGELLDGTNQFTEITGGWGGTMQFTALSATEAIINSQGILFDKFATWQKKNTLKKVDVTGYRAIELNILCPKGLYISNGFYFGIYNNLTDAHNNAVRLSQTTIDRRDVTSLKVSLNIEGVSGEYYVAFSMLTVSPHLFTINKTTLIKE